MEVRTNLVRRPQLKVGSLYENNFINTYSVNWMIIIKSIVYN
jgi:hypothetical protein